MSFLKDLIIITILLYLFATLQLSEIGLAFAEIAVAVISYFLIKKIIVSKILNREVCMQREYFSQILMHDIRVPLIAQLRALELLNKGSLGVITEEQGEIVDNLENSCKQILRIISTILKTYRYENGKSELIITRFNFDELLKECFDLLSPMIKEKNPIIVTSESSSEFFIDADREDIKKVITNLISTALLYTKRNGKVVVKTRNNKNSLIFSVTSSGIKLTKQECDLMFKPSEHTNFSAVGTEIGLYLCKRIIEEHQGKISVSTDGISANTFAFKIPKSRLNSQKKLISAY